jgi:hypothetical protein
VRVCLCFVFTPPSCVALSETCPQFLQHVLWTFLTVATQNEATKSETDMSSSSENFSLSLSLTAEHARDASLSGVVASPPILSCRTLSERLLILFCVKI